MSKRKFITLAAASLFSLVLSAQPAYSDTRQQETLTRSLVAVVTSEGKTFLSWRHFDGDATDHPYKLYRNGAWIGSFSRTNYTLPVASSTDDVYELRVVDDGGNVVDTDTATPWTDGCLKLQLNRPAATSTGTYTPNDCSIGDIDGDGVMEIFVKWDPSTLQDNSNSGKTDNVLIDCYRLDGTFLWRIDLGPNIRAGAHYTQYLVYDFDGDGKAELICKTAPWSKDAKGKYVSNAATDDVIKSQTKNTTSYRNSKGYIVSGPEYITVFSGTDGHAIHTTWYNPDRAMGVNAQNTNPAHTSSWGDSYSGRSDRFLSAVAYLDGEHPSAIFSRGYYTQAFVWAIDFNGTELVHRWLHASVSNTKVEHYDASWTKTTKTYSSNTSGVSSHYTLYGNGNHNMTIGDVDGDGKDEIVWGSAAVDDDGQLLYSVGYGHGDAIHMGTFDPTRGGLQVFDVHEEKVDGNSYGWDLHDAGTGEVIYSSSGSSDNGRGICGHFLPDVDEAVFSSSNDRQQRSAKTGQVASSKSASVNFRIYWDGDLKEEFADGADISKFTTNTSLNSVVTLSGATCNSTKNTPNLQADLFGDWREEVILHDDDALYIHTTTTPTDYVVPCLLTDHIYRMAIAWQQSGYNQPPHIGYYLPDKAILVDDDNQTLLPDDYVQEVVEEKVTIKWTLAEGDITVEPTITTDIPEAIASTAITYGSQLEVSGLGQNNSSIAIYKNQTKFKSLQKNTSATSEQTIYFTLTPIDGYSFMPTRVSFAATRYGTDGGNFDSLWKNEGGSTTLASGLQPRRNADTTDSDGNTVSNSPYYTAYSYNSSSLPQSYVSGPASFGIAIYNLNANKELGFCQMQITGMLRYVKPFVMPSPTAISVQTDVQPRDNAYYDLQGRRMETPLTKGIYIRNGQKVVVR